jgi:hypothetical protein
MTIRKIIVTVLTISILTSCRHGYKSEDGKVYYEFWNEGSGQGKQLIEHVDAKTFQKLSFDCNCSLEFGKDKNHLFIDGELIKNIDPNTFKFIGNDIFRDKDSAYFFGFYNTLNDCVIKGISPDEIHLIKYPWAKAGNFLIHGRDTVHLDDINEFIPLDKDWGKTKKYIINRNRILFGADVETFKTTSSITGKDKNYSYESGFINRNDFKKTKYRTFDFTEKNLRQGELMEFVDIYDSLEPLPETQNEKIVIAEKLKLKGFTLKNIRQGNWTVGPRIISVTLSNKKCDCFVDKLYYYDYSKPSETEKEYKVTERIHCTHNEIKRIEPIGK